jgi:hypothetical protein
MNIVDRRIDRMRVKATYRIVRHSTLPRVAAMARTTSPGGASLAMWEVKLYRP